MRARQIRHNVGPMSQTPRRSYVFHGTSKRPDKLGSTTRERDTAIVPSQSVITAVLDRAHIQFARTGGNGDICSNIASRASEGKARTTGRTQEGIRHRAFPRTSSPIYASKPAADAAAEHQLACSGAGCAHWSHLGSRPRLWLEPVRPPDQSLHAHPADSTLTG